LKTEKKLDCLKCKKCGKLFVKKHKNRDEKYCSKECWSIRGTHHEMKCIGCGKVGLVRSTHKFCSRECAHKQRGELAQNFKGEAADYSAIHKWIRANYGKPEKCLYCKTQGKRMHWANIDHKYTRNINDWIPLCAQCHSWFDNGNEKCVSVVLKRWQDFTGKQAVKEG
jgi:hypothetical protein